MENQENKQLLIIEEQSTEAAPMVYHEREAIKGDKALEANKTALRNTVKVAVMKAFRSLGKSIEQADATFIVDGLTAEVLRAYPGIRLSEIQLAIHKGAVGEVVPIEKIFTLSLSIFVQFIRSYMQSDSRLNALKEQNKSDQGVLLLEQKTQMNDSDRVEHLVHAYEIFKKEKVYNDWGNITFNYLYRFGLVNLTEETKVKAWREAWFKLRAELSWGRTLDHRRENAKLLEEIEANPNHSKRFSEAKKILLNVIFAEFESMDVDLVEMLKDKEPVNTEV